MLSLATKLPRLSLSPSPLQAPPPIPLPYFAGVQITREAQLIEQEQIHINALLAEGKTRQEIAQMGLFSALDPNVMGPQAS